MQYLNNVELSFCGPDETSPTRKEDLQWDVNLLQMYTTYAFLESASISAKEPLHVRIHTVVHSYDLVADTVMSCISVSYFCVFLNPKQVHNPYDHN